MALLPFSSAPGSGGGGVSVGGGITGGADKSVLFEHPAGTIAEDTNFLFDASTDTLQLKNITFHDATADGLLTWDGTPRRLTLNTAAGRSQFLLGTPSAELSSFLGFFSGVSLQGLSGDYAFQIMEAKLNNSLGGSLLMGLIDGSERGPNETLSTFYSFGSTSATFTLASQIVTQTQEDWSLFAGNGTKMLFGVIPNGGTSVTNYLGIDGEGYVTVNPEILDLGFRVKDTAGNNIIVTQGGAASLGFFAAAPIPQPTVTGSRGGNVALASLLTQLANLGLIINSSS